MNGVITKQRCFPTAKAMGCHWYQNRNVYSHRTNICILRKIASYISIVGKYGFTITCYFLEKTLLLIEQLAVQPYTSLINENGYESNLRVDPMF